MTDLRAGYHLGNWGSGPDGESARLIREARPGALLCMENVQPTGAVADWATHNPDGYLILRKHFAHGGSGFPSKAAVMNWAAGQREMLGNYIAHDAIRRLYAAGRVGIKIFNEPNFDFEGFGQSDDALRAYNDLYPVAVEEIKREFPNAKAIGYSLAPGNQDCYFKGDESGPLAHYWLHGPEASKGDPANPNDPNNPTAEEIAAAARSCLTRTAQQYMDWFGCHVYPLPGTWDKLWLGRRFEQYWKFLPQRLRDNTFILECSVADAAGQSVRATETRLFLEMLRRYPGIRAITLWWLRPGDPTWERHFHTEPSGEWRPVAHVVKAFNLQAPQPQPEPPPTPTPTPDPTPEPSPQPEPGDRILDYEGLPLSIRPATVAPGAKYWRIRKAVALNPEESRGIHNVYVRCYRNGQRVIGQEVRQFWPSGAATGKTEAKPLEEWGDINFGLFGDWNPFDAEGKPTIPGPYGVEVVGASEAFVGMGLPRKQHFSYIVEFEEVTMAQPQPAPQPTPGVVDHPSQHWSPRDGRKPRYIIIHSTETPADGTTAGTLQYLTQNDRQVSIHELIMPGHPVYRMVPDDRAAHHVGYATLPNGAGGFEANLQTWGEELYNVAGRPVDKETRDRGVARAAEACKRLGLTSAEVLGHREVDPARRSDPTGIDMDAFRRDVATLLGEKREPDFRKVVWATEEAARILQREGLLVEHDYIVKEVLPPLIAKRDAA